MSQPQLHQNRQNHSDIATISTEDQQRRYDAENSAIEARLASETREAAEAIRPTNTNQAYLPKREQFKRWCNTNDYRNHLVTEMKIVRFATFIKERGHIVKQRNSDGPHSMVHQSYAYETIKQYIKACVDYYVKQQSEANSIPYNGEEPEDGDNDEIEVRSVQGTSNENHDIQTVKPAPNIKVLKIFGITENMAHSTFFTYAISKYPQLDELVYNDNTQASDNSLLIKFVNATVPSLKKLTIYHNKKSSLIIESVVNCATRLESLDVLVYYDLQLLHKILSNKSYRVIHSLTLHQLSMKFKIGNLVPFTNLETVELDFTTGGGSRKTIPEEYLVSKLPISLRTLGLINVRISTSKKKVLGVSKIVKLVLSNVTHTENNISLFLSNHFHSLKTLTIDKCTDTSNVKLPNHYLQSFKYIPFLHPKKRTCCSIMTSQRTYYYKLPISGSIIYNYIAKKIPNKENRTIQRELMKLDNNEEEEYMFSLNCKNVENVHACGNLLLL